ncbi:hypothetical protein CDR81_09050 [Listeria monocytogenes]|nr:hypothetical protein [Listeria monocytogenes]
MIYSVGMTAMESYNEKEQEYFSIMPEIRTSEVLIGVGVLILTIFNLFTYVTYVVLTFVFY